MRDRCVAAVQRAAGREMSQRELQGIEDRINRHMMALHRADPAGFARLPSGERLSRAAAAAVDELLTEANAQKARLQLQIAADDRNQRLLGNHGGGVLDGLKRLLISVTDGKGSFQSIETRTRAIFDDAMRQLQTAFDALDPRMLGLFENDAAVVSFTRALFGAREGIDPKFVKAAEEWRSVAGAMRDHFNAAGGKIGALADWVMPQHHSQLRVARAAGSADYRANRDKWVADVFPKLDRSRYIHDDGRRYDDAEMRSFLESAWLSIATNGRNEATQVEGTAQAMLANRHAAHREIHFKDADAWLEYHQAYADGSLLKVMTDHVRSLARDTAAIETLGPNPHAAFQRFLKLGIEQANKADPLGTQKHEQTAVKLATLWNFTMGEETPVANERLAKGFDTVRNWLVSTRLGSAVIASMTDEGTMHITAGINGLSHMQLFANELRALNLANKEELRQARRAGLAIETMIGDLNRWGQEEMGSTVSSKLAHATLRASGLNAITDVRRRAFGVTMMDAIGHLTRERASLAALDEHDHRILLSKGITERDWAVWRAAEPEAWGGNGAVLTPDAIYRVPDAALAHLVDDLAGDVGKQAAAIRRDAALKLMGAVSEEVDMAVVTPRQMERAATTAGFQRGTWRGELARTVFLFKMTPIAMVWRHWQRALAQESGADKLKYAAALIASTTLLGAFTMQIKELLAGRDPRALVPGPHADGGIVARNWIQAILNGGSFGIYGDFLFSNTTQGQSSVLGAALGPMASMAEQVFNLTQGNIVQAAQGKDTKIGGELVRFGKQNVPLLNLWYTKAALDHAIWNQLAEYAAPGYLAKQERRMEREFGASHWWAPDQVLPQRAPDLARAAGQ